MIQLGKVLVRQMTSRISTYHTINIVRPQETQNIPSYKVESLMNKRLKKKSLRKRKKSLIQTNLRDFTTEHI